MEAANHWPYACDGCAETFPNQDDLEQHMNERGHWRYYCNDCRRQFQNENNLRMVLSSIIFFHICLDLHRLHLASEF